MTKNKFNKSTRSNIMAAIAVAGALVVISSSININSSSKQSSSSTFRRNLQGDERNSRRESHRRNRERQRQRLERHLRVSEFSDPKSIYLRSDLLELQSDTESKLSTIISNQNEINAKNAYPAVLENIKPYTLQNALAARTSFRSAFLVIIYDPKTDQFIPHYTNRMKRNALTKTLWASNYLTDSFRNLFPERFTPDSPEFAVAIGGGDYPSVMRTPCIMEQSGPCVGEEVYGPILQFGTAYKSRTLPSMIPMPMPIAMHLRCFARHARPGGSNEEGGCHEYTPRYGKVGGLVYGDMLGLEWDDLIPQVVWRGTDFTYLTQLYYEPFRQPWFDYDIERQIEEQRRDNEEMSVKEAAANALESVYDVLLPRWKGVAWTARAEVEAEQQQQQQTGDTGNANTVVPWCNIKFARGRPTDSIDFNQYAQVGINAQGEHMSLDDLAKYKYHIDIGGGGGTTWSGTMQKLAMPGLLFHHETIMKDYYDGDWVVPWEHYVPVREDLKDLREKFEWAENNRGKNEGHIGKCNETGKIPWKT